MSHNCWAYTQQLLKPTHLEPHGNYWAHILWLLKLACPRAHAVRQKKPLQWEAHTLQQSGSYSLQLERACVYQRRPSTVKNKQWKSVSTLQVLSCNNHQLHLHSFLPVIIAFTSFSFFSINISIYLHISKQWAYAVILDSSVVYVIHSPPTVVLGLPCTSDSKESACNVGDVSLIPGLGRAPREEKGYPLQYSCLESSMDRGGWWVTFHGVTELDTTEWLTLKLFHFIVVLIAFSTLFPIPHFLSTCRIFTNILN